MAVDLLVVRLRGDDLRDDLRVVVDDAVGVHHLGQTLHSGVVIERVDGTVVQVRAGFIHRRGRDAGRQHEPHVDRQTLGGLEHVVDAVGAHDVRDLMGVGDDRGRAVRQRRADELLRRDQAGFQMDVRVDKAWADDLARHIVFDFALIAAETHDQAVGHGDIARQQLVGEHVDVGRVLEDQIGLLAAGGSLDHALLLDQLPLDLARIAFSWNRHMTASFLRSVLLVSDIRWNYSTAAGACPCSFSTECRCFFRQSVQEAGNVICYPNGRRVL